MGYMVIGLFFEIKLMKGSANLKVVLNFIGLGWELDKEGN